jgi:Nuclease-related domain
VAADDDAMAAGDSARREHERRAAAHARDSMPAIGLCLTLVVPLAGALGERFAPGLGLWLAILAGVGTVGQLWPGRAHVDSWLKGAVGEEIVARTLEELGPDYVVMHDVRAPRKRANIDHVVVGPTGIFVIETKHVAGPVTLAGTELRVRGRRCPYPEQAEREADQVTAVLAETATTTIPRVHPLLCFTKADVPRRSTRGGLAVPLLTPRGVLATIRSSPRVFEAQQVRELASVLTRRLQPA